MMNYQKILLSLMLAVTPFVGGMAQVSQITNTMRRTDKAFFKTDEARRVGDEILLFQRVTGGWPKNIDMTRHLSGEETEQIRQDKSRRDDSTTDNDATSTQLKFLARLWQQTKDNKYREGFAKGVEYLLSGQYDNGGWPQFWPQNRGYQVHITYNDDAMANTMMLLRDIADSKEPYQGKLVDKSLRRKAAEAFDKGVDCILKTQIIANGKPTVWCQQHDHVTLRPAPARAYELPSYCSAESAVLIRLLMSIPNPDEGIKHAVHSAMQWLDDHKITGYRYVHSRRGNLDSPSHLDRDNTAGPIWARFYDLEYESPYVCDRDGIPRRHLEEIGAERRNGYSWYNNKPAALYPLYEEWAAKHDPAHKLPLSLNSKGGNERGVFEMFHKDSAKITDFDAVVNAGERIQDAIAKAPEQGTQPFKILVRKGTYNEKVIIDRPNIVLVGEQRDSTRIVYAELRSKMKEQTWNGKPVGPGVITLLENADDCVISGLTVYNNYGTTVEKTTAHQFAIYGRATRTIVINCNVWADGNDALSLWGKGGMYYHADLNLRCLGVDFLCPRGWCYATRCNFMGDGHAIIWHDGSNDKDAKLVITNSKFDAMSPTPLGRYHHDSQFYLVECKLSENILDQNIRYAYIDKVLDPCPWGLRVYYYGCSRDGGHSGWLNDNLQEAEGSPEFHAITAQWTFDGKWNPEKRVRDLWNVLTYSVVK
mgnify:CR=1 FL=1